MQGFDLAGITRSFGAKFLIYPFYLSYPLPSLFLCHGSLLHPLSAPTHLPVLLGEGALFRSGSGHNHAAALIHRTSKKAFIETIPACCGVFFLIQSNSKHGHDLLCKNKLAKAIRIISGLARDDNLSLSAMLAAGDQGNVDLLVSAHWCFTIRINDLI